MFDVLQVRKVAEENGVDVSESIKELEDRAKQVIKSWRAQSMAFVAFEHSLTYQQTLSCTMVHLQLHCKRIPQVHAIALGIVRKHGKLRYCLFLQLRRDTYTRLTPVQRLQVARHPNRPTFLDIALNISDKFVELHGDRAGLDDPAMVCGVASVEGKSFMFIGHQKGRNTKVCCD